MKDEGGNRIGTLETLVDRAGNCYFNSAQALHAYEDFTGASAEKFLTVVAGRIPEKKKHDGSRVFETDILSRGMSAILTFGEKSEREKLAWTGALMDEVPITPGSIQEFTDNDGLVHRLSAFDRKSLQAPRPPYIQDEYLLDGLDHGELVSSERAFDLYVDCIRRAIERHKAKDTYAVNEWDKAKIRELVLSSIKFGNRAASGSRPTIEKSTRFDSIDAIDAPNSARGILIQTVKTYRYKNGQLDDIAVDVRWYEAFFTRRGKEWEWAPGYTEVTP